MVRPRFSGCLAFHTAGSRFRPTAWNHLCLRSLHAAYGLELPSVIPLWLAPAHAQTIRLRNETFSWIKVPVSVYTKRAEACVETWPPSGRNDEISLLHDVLE